MNLHRASIDKPSEPTAQSGYPLRLVSVRERTVLTARVWRQIGLMAVVYFLATLVSRFFVISPEILAPIWIPGGILLAGLLWLPGSAILPALAAVFVASLAGNVVTHVALKSSLVFSFANCVGGVLGAIALRRSLGPNPRIGSLRGLVHFALFGVTLANGIGAIVGAEVVTKFGYASFGEAWIIWFLSNAWGMLIVVPLISEWGNIRSFFINAVHQAWVELALISVLVSVIVFLIWSRSESFTTYAFVAPFLVFPLLVWMALRFGSAGATVGSLVVSGLVLFTTANGLGRFALGYESLHTRFVELQVFMTMATLCALVTAAVMADRERAEASLRYAGSIIESSHAAILGKTLDGMITSWNPGAERMYGYTAAEVIGRPVSILLPDDQADEMPAFLGRLKRGERIDEYESLRRKKNGEVIDVSLTISPIYDKDGSIIGASSIARDITRQKKAERILEQTNERLELSFEAAHMGAWVWDFRTDSLDWFGKQEALFGFGPDTFDNRGQTALARIHPDDIARVLHDITVWTSEKRTDYEQEFRVVWPDGSEHWLFAKGHLNYENGQAIRSIGINYDITERKIAEQARRESEERFRDLADNMSQFAWMADATGWLFWYNQRWYEYTGTTLEEMQGWGWRKVHHPDHVQRVADKFTRHLRTGEHWEDTFPLRGKDGEYRWFLSRALPIRDSAGNIVRWFGTNTDITEQRKAEQALRKSEKRLRVLTEALPQLVWTADPTGMVEYVNRRWCAYTGQTRQQALGFGSFDAVHPDDLASVEPNWQNAVRTGTQYQMEYRLRSKDGQYRWFLARGVPLRNDEGQVERWFGTCTDIHEMKMAQQALIRNEKLASVGRMAMTIAHEINNPLAAVMNTIFLSRSEPDMPRSALNYLDLADNELRRISHITRQALGFYRESATPQATSLKELLDSVTELLNGKIKAKHVEVERKFIRDVRVTAVPGELRQVLSNLVSNAVDAVSERGQIRLRISTSRDLHDQRTVRVSVCDNGTGISSTALPHIFEPFFTTKDTVGTGLGLWVSKQIVDKHKGCIRVRSCAEGERHGTVFSVVLPLQAEGESVSCPATPTAMAS